MEMNLQKYLSFVKAAEYGSFTRAAEVLHYSQSGVSRMIADLENEWHVTLLERGKGGVTLTSEGLALLPHARRLVAEYESLQAQVDDLNGLRSGLIRIATFSSVATHWLPPMIRAFRQDYPHIDYELLLGDYREIESWVREGRADCGFVRLPAGAGLDTTFLEEDPYLAVLPEDHPLAGCERFPAAALEGEPFLLLERDGNIGVAELLDELGVKPSVHFTTWDDYAIMSMVENHLGISLLPKLILRRIPYRIVVKELDVPACRRIGLALRDRAHTSPAVRRFLEYLPYRNG